jgi:ATP-dependent DNA helicase RecQ
MLLKQGIKADYYHAGLAAEAKDKKQKEWINNSTRIMVCTNAFGMGIDKPDVRVVVHYDCPDCLENYYQEAGRAGRDGNKSYAVLLCSEIELERLLKEADIRYPQPDIIRRTYLDLMNYLQVAAGSGEGASFDFDLNEFCERFHLDKRQTAFIIQILLHEELIFMNESGLTPTTVCFVIDKNELFDYMEQRPEFEPLIKGLLRSYEGIFNKPCFVFEGALARFTQTKREEVESGLKKLHQQGIISYQSKKEKPQIILLYDRMYADAFKIDHNRIRQRKKQFLENAREIIRYAVDTKKCRSKMIATYFSETKMKDCGVCDNCLQNKATETTKTEFEDVRQKILSVLKNGPLTVKEIKSLFGEQKEQKLELILQFLLAEELLAYEQDSVKLLK